MIDLVFCINNKLANDLKDLTVKQCSRDDSAKVVFGLQEHADGMTLAKVKEQDLALTLAKVKEQDGQK